MDTVGVAGRTDIVDLITADHGRIRRLFAVLDDAARRCGPQAMRRMLSETTMRISALLAAHIEAEEAICFPPLYRAGLLSAAMIGDAIADHNGIRHALREAMLAQPGSAMWWRAMSAARDRATAHLADGEQQILIGLRRHCTPEDRHSLGGQWLALTTTTTTNRGHDAGIGGFREPATQRARAGGACADSAGASRSPLPSTGKTGKTGMDGEPAGALCSGLARCAGDVIVRLDGEIDATSHADLCLMLALAGADRTRIILDCAALKYLDAAGLRFLIAARRRARAAGGDVLLERPHGAVRRLLEITGWMSLASPEGSGG